MTVFMKDTPWWESKTLEELNSSEWEALCDGCGKCCLFKLEDVKTGEVHYSNASCKLLDITTGRCTHYQNRNDYIPNCLTLTPEIVRSVRWLPPTCAYRLLTENKPLPNWHPLITGNIESVKAAKADVFSWLERMHIMFLKHSGESK